MGSQESLEATRTFRIDSAYRKRVVEACMMQARKFTDDQTFLDAIEENKIDDNVEKNL